FLHLLIVSLTPLDTQTQVPMAGRFILERGPVTGHTVEPEQASCFRSEWIFHQDLAFLFAGGKRLRKFVPGVRHTYDWVFNAALILEYAGYVTAALHAPIAAAIKHKTPLPVFRTSMCTHDGNRHRNDERRPHDEYYACTHRLFTPRGSAVSGQH